VIVVTEEAGVGAEIGAQVTQQRGVDPFDVTGIRVDQARDYLSRPSVETVGGSWMVSRDLITRRDFAGVTAASRAAVEAIS